MTRGTAFHPRTLGLNARLSWEDWWGFAAASTFGDSVDIEYNAVREACAAIDVSPLFKYRVSGPDAERLVDRVITRDASKIRVGQVAYTPWCDERGKVIDDGTVCRLADGSFRWTAAEPNLRWITQNARGLDVRVEDVSREFACLALQGPPSRAVLEAATDVGWGDLRYFRERPAAVSGVELDVTRTGYTGDLGYELWIPSTHAVEVWDALFAVGADHGLRPVGMAALDVVRVEAGLILLDSEFTGSRNAFSGEQEFSPFELGLGKLVAFEKRWFVGKRALAAERDAGGPSRRLVGLEHDWTGIEAAYGRHGIPVVLTPGTSHGAEPVLRGGRQIGKATSTTFSPMLKKVISLALLDRSAAEEGTVVRVEWTVEGTRELVSATVVPLPFLDLERKRSVVAPG
jgi:aminomethyltransferase